MNFDVVVIGAGPGGYVAAIRAAQLGLKTACIEKEKSLGGTCLNVGCIPSKAMLHASEQFHQASHLGDWGIQVQGVQLDLAKLLAKKDKVVKGLTTGIAGLFKKNGVTSIQGTAKLLADKQIQVTEADGSQQTLSAKNIIIATGSAPIQLPFMPFDGQTIVDSTGALAFDTLPKHLVVVGGGVIGLELGSVWNRLGAQVTVVEFMDRVAITMDRQVSKDLQKQLGRQGIKFQLNTKVTGCLVQEGKAILTAENAQGERQQIEADKVLVCVGRRAYTDGLGCEEIGLERDKAGRIVVDGHLQSGIPGLYAIGDVVHGPMLAHKAEDEGIAVAERIAGKPGHVNYDAIPGIIYTHPEAASVGKTEEELKENGIPYKAGSFPFRANSRARCVEDVEGFVKILAHAETDRILGVHMLGPMVSELIQEAVLAMEFSASAEDLARTVHGHPGFGEAIKEAALGVDGRTIHF
ncbi:MAG: dihydrolipoyl dehydrogenase [Acidobacteria bacterium]|nr:dihydrolipoyl dehydrogenase [Acidobacteriota bacterium]MCB9398722.1 dihydrolipoyl dehydrogenase [Acidobacteriota bacterium]